MTSINTSVRPDKESVYYQGSLAQMQARQFTNINRDNITFMEIIKNEPRKQSYTDTTEFDKIISKFPFLSNKFIYKKVVDDARVIPDDVVMKNRMDEYFSPRFYKNIHRMYQNSPLYFDYLFSSEGIAEQRHKQYSVYIYTLCLIEYIMKHYDSNDFKLIRDHQLYYEWALPKYSEQVSYIIKGPLSKSSSIKIDFKKHYASIMNPSNVEGDMTQFLQLASLQNLDAKLNQFFLLMSKMNNAYDKLKDEARTYNLVIRARNTKCYNDPLLNNTFVIDLRGSDFGETDYALASTASLDTTVGTSSFDMSSRLSLHKLQELFTKYSRFRIVSLNVNRELYNIKLDTLDSVDIRMEGVALASRTVNVINSNTSIDTNGQSVSVSGRFNEWSNNIVSFMPFVDITTYNPGKVRVNDARIYITSDGLPLSAKNIAVTFDNNSMYNIRYHNNGTVTNDITLFVPQIYTQFNSIIPDNVAYIYNSIGELLVLYDNILIQSAKIAYNNGTPLLITLDKYTINYSVNGVTESIALSYIPSAEQLRDVLGIAPTDSLDSLTITLGNVHKFATDSNLNEIPSNGFSSTELAKSLLYTGHMYDSANIMSNLGPDSPAFGYGYFLVFHHRSNGTTDITSVTPNNMMIHSDDLDNLVINLGPTTNGDVTTFYLHYSYSDKDNSTYTPVPLTIHSVTANDTINVFFYDAINNNTYGYHVVFSPTIGLKSLNTDWYVSPIIQHNPYDILNVIGSYNSSMLLKLSPFTTINESAGLYMIDTFVPVLYSSHIGINGAILLKNIERLGYGNETLTLSNDSGTVTTGIPFISWESFTILPSLYMTNISAKNNTLSMSNMEDIFNIQIEFS